MKRFTVAVVALSGCVIGPACQAIVGIEDRVEAIAIDDAGPADVTKTPAAETSVPTDAPTDTPVEVAPPAGCPANCLPVAPDGWKGPSAFFDGVPGEKPTECPAQYGVNELETHTGMSFAPATCICSAPVVKSRYCTATITIHSVGPCKDIGTVEGTALSAGVCYTTKAASAPGGYVVGTPTLVPGTCTYPNLETTLPPPTFGKVQLACGRAQVPACGARLDCVDAPAVGAPFDRLCIHKEGEHDCPSADYSEKSVVYKGVDEARSCTPCTEGVPSGGVCGTQWGLNSSQLACSSMAPQTLYQAGTCQTYPGAGRLVDINNMAPSAGTCPAPGGGAPAGDVKSSGPVTFCCAK